MFPFWKALQTLRGWEEGIVLYNFYWAYICFFFLSTAMASIPKDKFRFLTEKYKERYCISV
jgi:hypothetical protein